MIFFAGVSITLASSIDLLQNLPGNFWKHPDRVLQDDYQQSSRFRGYISDRLETFLAMATNSYTGCYDNYYDYNSYYGYAYPGSAAWGLGEDVVITSKSTASSEAMPEVPEEWMSDEELEDYYQWQNDLRLNNWYDGAWADYGQESPTSPLTEEQREEQRRKLAQRYHDSIKGDENLLYSIAYDGKVLYANSELQDAEGNITMPEGYNFLLQYADGKVRIFKDGTELDVYGDGYYRDDSEWYVPGYRNFTVDEETKKAVIYMAVSRDPVLYTESSYAKENYRQMDNSLYWMQYNILANRKWLIRYAAILAVGLALLVMAFLLRKSKREADISIARFTGKIWFEGKILLCLLILYPLFLLWITGIERNYGDFGRKLMYWTETAMYYEFDGSYFSSLLSQVFYCLPDGGWLLLFWLIYLAVNDLRHNKKVWRHGLTARLHRTFYRQGSTAAPACKDRSSQRRRLCRCRRLWSTDAGGRRQRVCPGLPQHGNCLGHGQPVLSDPGGISGAAIPHLRKNMELARDLEALSGRIRDIRNGNYGGFTDGSAENGVGTAAGMPGQNENSPLRDTTWRTP